MFSCSLKLLGGAQQGNVPWLMNFQFSEPVCLRINWHCIEKLLVGHWFLQVSGTSPKTTTKRRLLFILCPLFIFICANGKSLAYVPYSLQYCHKIKTFKQLFFSRLLIFLFFLFVFLCFVFLCFFFFQPFFLHVSQSKIDPFLSVQISQFKGIDLFFYAFQLRMTESRKLSAITIKVQPFICFARKSTAIKRHRKICQELAVEISPGLASQTYRPYTSMQARPPLSPSLWFSKSSAYHRRKCWPEYTL